MRDGGVNKTDILSLVKILTLWGKKQTKPNQQTNHFWQISSLQWAAQCVPSVSK